MAKYIQILIIAFLFVPHSLASAQEGNLFFIDVSLQDAYQIAHEGGKVFMLVFGTEYCTPCRRLEREVLSDREVTAYLEENAVTVYIDPSVRSGQGGSSYKIPERGVVGEHYGVVGFPIMIFSRAKASPQAMPLSARIWPYCRHSVHC